MNIFTYHHLELSFFQAIRMMFSPLNSKHNEGLIHAETMSAMVLGSSILSPSRFFSKKIVVFAQWESEEALQFFLDQHPNGKLYAKSWYIQLELIREWGEISGFKIPKLVEENDSNDGPVVAVTLARMKFLEIPRFLRWGRPVEKLVRDHPGTVASLASIRYPNLISTFSIWNTQKEMREMVTGRSKVQQPKRHIDAMKERQRKDFHDEFTTLRFKPIAEFGTWKMKNEAKPIFSN